MECKCTSAIINITNFILKKSFSIYKLSSFSKDNYERDLSIPPSPLRQDRWSGDA